MFVLILTKVVRSGDLVSYCAEEGVRILGEGKFLVSDSFPGNERTKYCLTSKVNYYFTFLQALHFGLVGSFLLFIFYFESEEIRNPRLAVGWD